MALDKADDRRGGLSQKSILHLDDEGVKKRNSYSLLVMIDCLRTYITHNITVKPLLSGHLRDLPKFPLDTGL